jgi:hypothetical protein
MAKKILYILLGALLIFGLLFVLWSWWTTPSKPSTQTGTFGTASSTGQNAGASGSNTNGQVPLGSNTTNGTIPLGNTAGNGAGAGLGGSSTNGGTTNGALTNGGGATTGSTGSVGTNGNVSTGGVTVSTTGVGGVDWLAGSGSGALNGTGFNPTAINSINNGANGFTPNITSINGGSGGGLSLGAALAGAAIAGTISCALQAGVVSISAGGAGASALGAGGSLVLSTTGAPVSDFGAHTALTYIAGQQTTQVARNAAKDQIPFFGCITNVVAKTVLKQITLSVVNWINSGFNGQPAFVNDYQQFFTNVADSAAGQFIQGSGLAFLCSPFQLQIKIAIAKSYANRGAQSCTLSGVIKNVNSFMNGNFAQGGWPGFISFTTVPTNNPYGAFAYAQVGLANAQSAAVANANRNISPTGFLNLQMLSNCANPANNGLGGSASLGLNPQAAVAGGKAALPTGCKPTIVTPGGVIAESLGAVNKSGVDQLGLANDLDQIISALTTQLMTRVLQNGLTSISQSTTQSPADLAAQSQATSLLNDMQSKTTLAQQLGSIAQGSISDIEQAQGQLNSLANCWSSVASSSKATPDQQAQAATSASTARSTLASLNTQIDGYNTNITQLNSEISALNQFESDVSLAATAADVANITSSYNASVAAGNFVSTADLTTAQQNRTTLQAQMSTLNTQTQAGLAQCNAILQQ